jgi:hypothetical protein
MELTEVDPEVAAATLAADLATYWSKGLPELRGITRLRLHPLTEIIGIPGRRPDGTLDPYHLKIEANHYGPHPVRVRFVEPLTWAVAQRGSPWLPVIENAPPWFGLHPLYDLPDGPGQLVCFSFSLDYYTTNHTPGPTEIWRQGERTVAATINRLYEILGPQYYRGRTELEAAA